MAIKDIFTELEEKKAEIENLSIDALREEMGSNEELLLLDLREIQERVDLGSIPAPFTCHAACWSSGRRRQALTTGTTSRKTGERSCSVPEAAARCWRCLPSKTWGSRTWRTWKEGFRGWKEGGHEIEDVASTSRWVRRDA